MPHNPRKRLDKDISQGDLVGRLQNARMSSGCPYDLFEGSSVFSGWNLLQLELLSFSSKTKQSVWNIGIRGLCWVWIPLQITHWTIVVDKLRVQKKSKPNCWLELGEGDISKQGSSLPLHNIQASVLVNVFMNYSFMVNECKQQSLVNDKAHNQGATYLFLRKQEEAY